MKRPIIGITTSYTPAQNLNRAQQSLNHDYILAVEKAGGCPLILPMTENTDTLASLYNLLNGLIITGGPGIVEGLVGALPIDLPPVEAMRHNNDLRAFEHAQEKEIPILGICYGMQFINAQLGGTLYADVQNQRGTKPHSPKRTDAPVFHNIAVQSETHLSSILQTQHCETNSYHLQAIDKIGQSLRISATSIDQVIEGIETEDGRIIGVQFHPEKMPNTIFDRIFTNLILKASQ